MQESEFTIGETLGEIGSLDKDGKFKDIEAVVETMIAGGNNDKSYCSNS